MADYLSISDSERKEMLNFLGITDVGDLYADVPKALRRKKFALAEGKSQQEVYNAFKELAARNATYRSIFRGAGSYNHYIPSAVKSLASREEFLTAYTPYQPELSQGILQATFEFQTMMCNLTGMDVATASHYSGATAAAEACVMCAGAAKKVVTFANVNPDTLETVRTYLEARGIALDVLPALDGFAFLPDEGTGADAVYIESPNYYGILEDTETVIASAHAQGAKVIVGGNPLALALFKSPGELGADVARRTLPRIYGGEEGVHAQAARQDRRRDDGCRGQTCVRAHAADQRTAHPQREGDFQHLLQSGALRADRCGISLPARTRRAERNRDQVRIQRALSCGGACGRRCETLL